MMRYWQIQWGDAMEQFEDMVVDHIQEEIAYYEEMLEKFQEE